jgi:hypothetical protein
VKKITRANVEAEIERLMTDGKLSELQAIDRIRRGAAKGKRQAESEIEGIKFKAKGKLLQSDKTMITAQEELAHLEQQRLNHANQRAREIIS